MLHTLRGDDTLTDSIKVASAVEEVDPRIREVIARLTGDRERLGLQSAIGLMLGVLGVMLCSKSLV